MIYEHPHNGHDLALRHEGAAVADLLALATQLKTVSTEFEQVAKAMMEAGSSSYDESKASPRVTLQFVRALIRGRRARSAFFPGDLFADPAWDILLELTAARLEGRRVCVSDLTIAAAVPATTALRWIKTMTVNGMLVRHADPTDARRCFITLSEEVYEKMLLCLSSAYFIIPDAHVGSKISANCNN